jgi:hypothetical protein
VFREPYEYLTSSGGRIDRERMRGRNEAAASSHHTLLYDSEAAIVLATKELMAHDTVKVDLTQTSWYDTKFESN